MTDNPLELMIVYDVDAAGLAHDSTLLGLFELWQRKRKTRALPARADFSHQELRPWFGRLVLLQAVDGGADFRFRLMGMNLVSEVGFDHTGGLMSELPNKTLIPHFLAVHREALRRRTPILAEHKPEVDTVKRRRRLILPLGKDGAIADMTMTASYPIAFARNPDRYL